MIFEAVYTNTGYTTTVAVDDVSFSDGCAYDKYGNHGDLPTPPPGPSNCDPGYYPCAAENKCYETSQRCDFFDFCGDAQYPNGPTDENSCGMGLYFFIDPKFIDYCSCFIFPICSS